MLGGGVKPPPASGAQTGTTKPNLLAATPRAGWPGWWQIWPVTVFGVAAALGQAPWGAWWISLPAFAALIFCTSRAKTTPAAIYMALFGGVGYFALALSWLIEPFLIDAETYAWMAPFAVILLAFGLALFWAGAAAVARFTPNRAMGFALTLTFAELARGYVLTGFPWALIGHIWIETPIAQLAALIGPSGLTLLTLIAAGLLAQVTNLTSYHRAMSGLAVISLIAAAWAYGHWALAQPSPAAPGVTLRLIQPNADQHMKWEPAQADKFFNRLLAYSAVKPTPDLVIWPETALPYSLERNPELIDIIAKSANGAPVLLGRQRIMGTMGWNSLSLITPQGQIAQTYDKHHLVPFGEYIPFGDLAYTWFGLTAFAAQQGNGYTPGPGPRLLDLGPKLGQVLPLICYEAVFPQDLRGTARPDWILQVTNDAWFGTMSGPFQHLAQARLRAIEQGLPLVRVANTGVTGIYDARGREMAALGFGTAAYLDAQLPGALPIPLYARYGEIPVLVLLGGLCAVVFRRRAATIA